MRHSRRPGCRGSRATRVLSRLWEALVDQPGTVVVANPVQGSGKTCLAQEFARQAAGQFRDVLLPPVGRRSVPGCGMTERGIKVIFARLEER